MKWQVVPCGPRNEAYRRFCEAAARGRGNVLFLLVDSEDGVRRSPRLHLVARDGWDDLEDVAEDRIQLMVRTMETWLIADVETLRSYYGNQFNDNALPRRQDLEKVPKENVSLALARATQKTQKGEYHKIRHASELLARVDPEKVKARCRHCKRLFDTLTSVIEAA